MTHEAVLRIVLREIRAYGAGWRYDWSDFDGRTLKIQLDDLAEWAVRALEDEKDSDCTEGSDFKTQRGA